MYKKKSTNTPVYKKWWFWVIIVLVVAAIAGLATQGSQNNTDNPDDQKTSQDTPDDKLTDLKVGDSVTIYGVTVTVNSIVEGKPALMETTPTYDVNITYKNNSGSSITINPYDWQTVLRTGSDKAHVGGDVSFHAATLKDGEEWTGIVNLWGDDEPTHVAFESTSVNLGKDDKRATWLIK